MKNQFSELLKRSSWLFLLLVIVIGCNLDDGPSPGNAKISSTLSAKRNTTIVTTAQEVYDISGAGLASQGIPNGRVADSDDGDDDKERLCGAIVTKTVTTNTTFPDSLILTGSITVDFGDGTSCQDSSHRRTGKMTTEFTINVSLKNRHLYNSTETITFDNFTKNSHRLAGTYHFRTMTGGVHFLDVVNAKLDYKDGEDGDDDDGEDGEGDDDDSEDSVHREAVTITWSGSLTFTRSSNGTITRDDDTKTITGNIAGTSSDGETFSANITSPVIIKWACFGGKNIPVQGTIEITRSGTATTVDFGDGTCDKLYTATTAGQTTDLHF